MIDDNGITDVDPKSLAPTGATAEQILEVSQKLQTFIGLYFFVREAAANAESGGIPIHCKMMNGTNYQLAINSNLVGAVLTDELNKLAEELKAQGINLDGLMVKLSEQYDKRATA